MTDEADGVGIESSEPVKADTGVHEAESAMERRDPPPLATKARDLDALRAAVVDAATVGAGFWISLFIFLFVFFYLCSSRRAALTHSRPFFFVSGPIAVPECGSAHERLFFGSVRCCS